MAPSSSVLLLNPTPQHFYAPPYVYAPEHPSALSRSNLHTIKRATDESGARPAQL